MIAKKSQKAQKTQNSQNTLAAQKSAQAICQVFAANGFCPREAQGGCTDKHDWNLWALNWQIQKLAALRSFITDNTVAPEPTNPVIASMTATITAKSPKSTTPVIASNISPAASETFASPIVSKDSSIIAPTNDRSIQVKELTPIASSSTPLIDNADILTSNTSIQKSNKVQVHVEALQTSVPNAPSLRSTSTIVSAPTKGRRQCNFYVNGKHCRFANTKKGCRDIHDLAAREANLAKQNPQAAASSLQALISTPATVSVSIQGRITGRQCKFYVNGKVCPFQNRTGGCLDIHDLKARRENILAKTDQLKNGSKVAARQSLQLTKSVEADRSALNHEQPSVPSPQIAQANDQFVPGITIPLITRGPAPFNFPESKKARSAAVKARIVSKSWDNSPSEWESWGKCCLSPRNYDKIIEPYLDELSVGIVSDAFLNEVLEGDTSAAEAAATFRRFPELPKELRDQIWKDAIFDDSSTCRVGFRYDMRNTGHSESRIINSRIVALSRGPRFSLVNSESRAMAFKLKVYCNPLLANGASCKFLFNFRKDRLFLHPVTSQEYTHVSKLIHCVHTETNSQS
jgi:hypothetical protein